MWIVPYTRRILSIMVTQRQTRSRDDLDVLTMVHFWWVRHTKKKKTVASKIDFSATPKKFSPIFRILGNEKIISVSFSAKMEDGKFFTTLEFSTPGANNQIPILFSNCTFWEISTRKRFVSPSFCLLWRLQFFLEQPFSVKFGIFNSSLSLKQCSWGMLATGNPSKSIN